MTVALRAASPSARRYTSVLRADAVRLLATMNLDRSELSVLIVNDEKIRRLNREFRGKDAPTDVLSFSQLEEVDGPVLDPCGITNARETILGDVIISIDTALRQADEFGVTVAERLRTLLIHGVLHLIGYDHERSPAEASRMFARERQLAATIAGSDSRPSSKPRNAGTRAGR